MPTATIEELDALYAGNPDPWDFRTSGYEARKYDVTLSMLPRARYRDALEVGCSIGVLGQRLAGRCDRYLGLDASPRALAVARAEALPSMSFSHMMVPREFPEGPFDLILLSEILYFLGPDDVARLARRVATATPDGDIVCVNTLRDTDRELSGEAAANIFIAEFGRTPDITCATLDYRLDVFRSPRGFPCRMI